MKRSIYFTLTALAISVLWATVIYNCCIPAINLVATLLFCISFVVFLVGCSLVWSHWTKNMIKDATDTYLGFFLIMVSMIAICSLLLFLNSFGMLVALITGFSGLILITAGEIKRHWKNIRKMEKPTTDTVSKTPEFTIVHKPRKVSQAEFKRIILFCKENNLGHLTVSQAIIAWDEHCSTH